LYDFDDSVSFWHNVILVIVLVFIFWCGKAKDLIVI